MKRIAFFLTIFVCFFIIQSLVRSIISLWEKQDLVVAQQDKLAKLKAEHEQLQKQEKRVNEPGFIEQEARNKLFLVKPNEKLVLLPTGILSAQAKQTAKKEKPSMPIYQQWIKVFRNGAL